MPAVVAAAASFSDSAYAENDGHDSMPDHIARGEELVMLLPDRGACAHDTVTQGNEQPWDMVLTLAISHASSKLVKRLINNGADIYTEKMHLFQNEPLWKTRYCFGYHPSSHW